MAERMIVIIDAGHCGTDPGGSHVGRKEKDDNLRLAMAVGSILAENGVDVRYTRTDDTCHTHHEKALMVNHGEADFFVSIHRNVMPVQSTGSGIELSVFENKGVPGMLARNLEETLNKTEFAILGTAERPEPVILKRTKVPAVMVGVGHMDNPEDNALFDRNFQEIAQAIADGILNSIREQEKNHPEYYQVQLGAYRVHTLAEDVVNTLKAQGFPAFTVYEDELYKVRVGAFRNIDDGVRMEHTLRQSGYDTLMVKRPAVV